MDYRGPTGRHRRRRTPRSTPARCTTHPGRTSAGPRRPCWCTSRGRLAARREALWDVYAAIVARLGEPTLYGGSSHGPSVRWRDSRRTVLLSGDRDTVGLSVHDTAALEGEEDRTFAWSGAWRADDPLGTGELPYLWRLDRGGPGESPPAARAAARPRPSTTSGPASACSSRRGWSNCRCRWARTGRRSG
ncbi:hypothetical protein ACFQ60_33200 [Streptomyces zhihengii]